MLTQPKDLRTGRSVWMDTRVPTIPTKTLTQDATADIVLVGAGISAAITAQALASRGHKVVMLDRRPPLSGSTAATTALLQYEIDLPILKLKAKVGLERAIRAWQRTRLALDTLADKVGALNIDCDLERRSSLYLAGNLLNAGQLRREAALRNRAGLHTDYLDRAELRSRYGIDRAAALLSFGNLTANPLRLAAGFLLGAQRHGAEIFSPVTVAGVESRDGRVVITTEAGPTVHAGTAIYATGYELPKGVRRTKHRIGSTWAIATRPQPRKLWPDQCLIWEASDPYLYVRALPDGRVICGGEDEDFQDEAARDALLPDKTARLEEKLGKLFPALDTKADYAWCGNFGSTPSGLPTIRRVGDAPNILAILAFGGNGITFSSLAAELLVGMVEGRVDIDAGLFR
ncbi:NAD(P)/FAD-dependent oxidoreductase [Niveispirillum sp. KHB5.9]|uniref:NAD(P)/FAD-dependent oxidoreductase n=1 Tax=Niveispirillum sp. KHB5.9 TaxID=3400269 RepID=UPI003A85639D